MSKNPQDPLFETPADLEAAAHEARRVARRRKRIPKLLNAAFAAVNAFSDNTHSPQLRLGAESALRKLLDDLVADSQLPIDSTKELDSDFVRLVMFMLRKLKYGGSFESYLMNVIASNRVNPGYVFRAMWPDFYPDHDQTPTVFVTRFQ